MICSFFPFLYLTSIKEAREEEEDSEKLDKGILPGSKLQQFSQTG